MEIYKNRDEKPYWVLDHFKSVFSNIENILDVGCGDKQLKDCLSKRVRYVGVDIYGDPEIRFDLSMAEKLPLEDGSFDLVYCADVLEHLENIHFIIDELFRISRKYIIMVLPNPYRLGTLYTVFRGRKYSKTLEEKKNFGLYMKYYGLPLEKPKDRHRWFFNTEEAVDFVNYRSKKNNYRIEKTVYIIDLQKGPKIIFKKILFAFNRLLFLNMFNHATWFLLEKNRK